MAVPDEFDDVPKGSPRACGPKGGAAPPMGFFGEALEPALRRACGGRLSELKWFRTDWQRGGALTGYAIHHNDRGEPREAVVKLPVPPRELMWMQRLQIGPSEDEGAAGPIVPRLYAGGRSLTGYDLAWVVMERLPHGPLDASWGGAQWDLLIEAAGRFYAAARRHAADQPPHPEDWIDLIRRSRQALRRQPLPDAQRWTVALKTFKKMLKKASVPWHDRDTGQWRHGDLHMGNAMSRRPPPQGPALLLDFAEVRPGHWVEDAVYLEHLYWARPDRLSGRDVVKQINRERKRHGLASEPHWPRLADIRRVLRAAAAPAEHARHPEPHHLRGALLILEKTLPRIG